MVCTLDTRPSSRTTIAQAQARGLDSAVVTFRNHPLTVLSPTFQPRYLMDLQTRLEAISSFGIDHTVAINFTKEVSQLRAREFVQRLSEGLNMNVLICGQDFALGKNREGRPRDPDKAGRGLRLRSSLPGRNPGRRPHRQQHRYPTRPHRGATLNWQCAS